MYLSLNQHFIYSHFKLHVVENILNQMTNSRHAPTWDPPDLPANLEHHTCTHNKTLGENYAQRRALIKPDMY